MSKKQVFQDKVKPYRVKDTSEKIKKLVKEAEEEGGYILTALEEVAMGYSNKSLCFVDHEITVNQCAFLSEMENNYGNISAACKKIGFTRAAYYKWIAQNPYFKACAKEVEEAQIDRVESKLLKMIDEGNVMGTMFYLKTKGRKRGYVEKVEIDNKLEVVGFDYVEVTPEKSEEEELLIDTVEAKLIEKKED